MTEPQAARETPATHQQQSVNGCVTCERRWDQHTPEEQASRAPARETLRPDPLTPDPRREIIADYLMDARMDGPWTRGGLTYQEGMRHYADGILAALRAATPDPAEPELREALRDAVRESERRGYATVTIARDDLAALLADTARTEGLDVARMGDEIGRAMHEAAQVGGPWAPCTVPYDQWPECEHQPMGQHVATIIAAARLANPEDPA